MKPLALFGGTFDPVHLGHLSVAWEASELLDAEVRLLPASVPPHRAQPRASAEQRVALLTAALRGQQRLGLDTRELDRQGPSYSVDTLAEVRAEQGARPLILLVGVDAFLGFPQWHRWRELFALAHVAVLHRPGYDMAMDAPLAAEVDARRVQDVQPLHAEPRGRIIELDVTPLEISATRVRALLAAGRDPRYLLPEGVFANRDLLAAYRDANAS